MGAIYGDDNVLDETRDKLISLLNDLKVVMFGSTDPHFEVVYSTHGTVVKQFNSISIDNDEFDSVGIGAGESVGSVITAYTMRWSIRIHTAYINGPRNGQKMIRLADSVKGYLQNHKMFDADSNFRIIKIGGANYEDFEESYTLGVVILLDIIKREINPQS